MTSTSRLLAVALLVAAALQATLWLLPAGRSLASKVLDPVADAREYEALAANLARDGSFSREVGGVVRPEFFRTPAWPVLLAGLRRLFGASLAAILGLQLLLSLFTVLAAWRLARVLDLPDRAAVASALFVAASPNLAFLATKALTETLFTLLLTLGLLFVARFRRNPAARELVGAGLTAGLMALTRPIAVAWPLVIAGYAGWRLARVRPRAAWLAAIPLLAAALVVAPWVARNYLHSGRLLLSTAAEHNLFLYNAATVVSAAERTTVEDARDRMQAEARARFGSLDSNDEVGYWARLGVVARDRLLRHPALAAAVQLAGFAADFVVPISVTPLLTHTDAAPVGPARVMQQALGFIVRGRFGAAWGVVRTGRLAAAGPLFWAWFGIATCHLLLLLVFAALGLFGGRGRGIAWLVLPVLYFTLLTGPVGEARFRAPVEPALAVLAAAAFARKEPGRAQGPTRR